MTEVPVLPKPKRNQVFYVSDKNDSEMIVECNVCGRVQLIPISSTKKTMLGYSLLAGVLCPCGTTAKHLIGKSLAPKTKQEITIGRTMRWLGYTVASAVAVLIAISVVAFTVASKDAQSVSSPPPTPAVHASEVPVQHQTIQLGDNVVAVGDPMDDALPKMKRYIVSNAGHRPDPRPGMSGSMMIWYYCDTSHGETWTVELARTDMDSPYVVHRIIEGKHNFELGEN